MKDLDKSFSDKLYNHKTTPPADLWTQLDDALETEQRKKRKGIYWRMAAAVSLLLVAGSLFWLNTDKHENETIARVQSAQKTLPRQKARPADKRARALQENPPQNKVSATMPRQEKKNQPVQTKEKPPVRPDYHGKALLQPAESLENPEDRHTVENTTVPNPLTPEPAKLGRQQPAVLDTEGPYDPVAITIIYKPGKQSGEDTGQSEPNSPLELLAELKDSGISFTEIRSAKTELLAKVFTKIDNKLSR